MMKMLSDDTLGYPANALPRFDWRATNSLAQVGSLRAVAGFLSSLL